MSIEHLKSWFLNEWHREERMKMKRLAHHYAERARMDGHVYQALPGHTTSPVAGEIIPKESV